MGGIHPRFKHEVGRRLAVALLKNVSGPTIAGCTLHTQADGDIAAAPSSITLSLDAARMGGEDIMVQPFDINVSAWRDKDSSTLMVCTGQLGPAIANATSCACSGWTYLRTPCDPARSGCNTSNHGHDQARWYCEAGPGWKPTPDFIEKSLSRHTAAAAAAAST